jgi:transketolase
MNKDLVPSRNGYGQGLVEAGRRHPEVVVLSADVTDSTRASYFKKEFPDRFIQVGVAEQNMIGIAAGLALSGKIPFVSSYAVFSPGRNWDQLRVSVCYSQANVKIAASHAGISVGPDGATHQALEDIAITRCLPNLVVIAPCDALETQKATVAAAEHQGPVYLRFARQATPLITSPNSSFKIGQAEILRQGKDVTIIGCGPLLHQALLAAEQLAKEKISAEVINNHTIKPLDKKTLLASVKKTKAVVAVEEHQVMGGMGSAVIEMLAQEYCPLRVAMIGMPDSFGESGTAEELLAKYGFTQQNIVKAVKKILSSK